MGGHHSMKHEEEPESQPHVPPAPVVKHLRVRRQEMEAPHRPLPARETSDDDDGIISTIAAVEIAEAIESTIDTSGGGTPDSGFSGFDGGATGGGGSGGDW